MDKIEKLLLKVKENGKRIIDRNGFGYFCLKNPEEFLNWAVLNGYILHGTTRKVTILKPQKAQDFVKESGNRIAVYMTGCPARAMFASLTVLNLKAVMKVASE